MSDTVIRVENLSKRYRIGAAQARYGSLRDSLAGAVKAPLNRLRSPKNGSPSQHIWALKDVSFEVQRGEVLGVIGRNGAGKSTLLKVLARITKPTGGRVLLEGRVGSLLEVGTGFHPELTGRENIYLNGAILGMHRAEIERKFDEIVDFAEIEQFLDTPAKHYSSGMYMRLAFAVAAHLEPEILLVDEVLAVGDAAFQKKCLGKMGQVAQQGRTVLFVSHNMAAVEKLCAKAILFDSGKLRDYDNSGKIIAKYLGAGDSSAKNGATSLVTHPNRVPGSHSILSEIDLSVDGASASTVRMGGELQIVIHFCHNELISNARVGISIEDYTGNRLAALSPSLQAPDLVKEPVQSGAFLCTIRKLRLVPGVYYLTLILGSGSQELDRIERAIEFFVESSDVFNTGYAPQSSHGVYYQDAVWEIKTSG